MLAKVIFIPFLLISFLSFGQSPVIDKNKKTTLVFIGGFGHTKMGLKKMFKDFKKRYPKLQEYKIVYYTYNTRLKKIKKELKKHESKKIKLAGYSIGANLALKLADELNKEKLIHFTFIDPWFTCSNWGDDLEQTSLSFQQKINQLPLHSFLIYGSDFVVKNNKGLSKIAGPFGTKQCKACYIFLKTTWNGKGRVFKSGAGHRYFPELYIKQFLNAQVLK